jgi:hypothetical protein
LIDDGLLAGRDPQIETNSHSFGEGPVYRHFRGAVSDTLSVWPPKVS